MIILLFHQLDDEIMEFEKGSKNVYSGDYASWSGPGH